MKGRRANDAKKTVFERNLQRIRRANNITGQELAKLIGIPYTTYVAYENRGREPRYDVLLKIADYLGVTPNELLGAELPESLIRRAKHRLEQCGFTVEVKRHGERFEIKGTPTVQEQIALADKDNILFLCTEDPENLGSETHIDEFDGELVEETVPRQQPYTFVVTLAQVERLLNSLDESMLTYRFLAKRFEKLNSDRFAGGIAFYGIVTTLRQVDKITFDESRLQQEEDRFLNVLLQKIPRNAVGSFSALAICDILAPTVIASEPITGADLLNKLRAAAGKGDDTICLNLAFVYLA
ncbi:MAG: hypothetical protein ACFWT7_01080 [Succiniclasticum sp.]|jgi:transcriptional regulator with XRE-family HTH domain